MNKTFDRYASIVFLAIGLFFVIASQSITQSSYGSKVGPSVFPFGLGLMLVLLSLRLLYETFRLQYPSKQKTKLEIKRFLIILVSAIVYVLLLEPVGYVITTFLFLFTGFQAMDKSGLWKSLVISAVIAVGVYYVYVDIMNGTLPGFPDFLSF